MRVVVNCRFLTQSLTGVQRYAIELSLRLKKWSGVEVVFMAPRNISQRQLADTLDVRCVGKLTGHLWEQLELPLYLKRSDLLVNFCNTAPLLHRKKVVTVHDLAFLKQEKWHSFSFRVFYLFLIPRLLKTATRIITVSQTMKNEMMRLYKVSPERINVIYGAVSEDHDTYPIRQIDEKYLLFVGSMDPRKNLARLIAAFGHIKTMDVKLKIVGGFEKSFRSSGIESNGNNRIEFLGRVDDNELVQLYSNAIGFVFPSLYEGFGLPPLEAMKRGCPVVGSDIDTLREIYGDAMLYFNPTDEVSIAEAIDTLCSSEALRMELIQRGKKQLESYSFEQSGVKLTILLEEISRGC